VVGSQTGRVTSLGLMTRLLRCGTLLASRVPGVPLGRMMTTTYLLECMCLFVSFSLLTDFSETLYACGTSVELWPYTFTMDGIIWSGSCEPRILWTISYSFYSFPFFYTCSSLMHSLFYSAAFTALLSETRMIPRIVFSCHSHVVRRMLALSIPARGGPRFSSTFLMRPLRSP
jgi:hypothetical protein